MPGCPSCGKVWPDHFVRCPEDGTPFGRHPGTAASMHGGAAPELAPVSDEDLPAGSFAGDYRIEKKIGEGGMGSVYGARHPLIGKRAAIKVIRRELSNSREAVDRFVLEAQSVNQIGHPNIVDVFGFGQLPDGRAFFVMEWLEGEALRDRLQRPLQFPEALEILEAIAKALQAAHEAGVVHRDLKPDNVFLQMRKGEKPEVKLLDFGLAKLTGQGEDSRFNQTRTGVVMGTPLYLSPEQAKGTKIDAATDVYSLGAMAYEMLSGTVPFKADSAVEIMAMHISRPATPVITVAPWVPPEINALVQQMLEKEPAARPITAEVRDRIAACRARASHATLGLAINPSSQPPPGSQPPYTPAPMQGMHTPNPYNTPAPPVGSGSHPPAMGYGGNVPAQASGGSKRTLLILVCLAVAGAAIGGALYVTVGNKKAAQVASNDTSDPPTEPAKADPAPTEPATADPAANAVAPTEPAKADPAPTEPAKTEPAKTEPAKTEPAKTEPAKTEPAKTEPAKTEPAKTEPVIKRPEPPKRGRVVVVFEGPNRAMIVVDGKPQGRETGGRVALDLVAGDHTIRVQSKGFKPAEAKVHVDAGGSRDVKLTLEKRSTVNSVHDPFDD